MDTNADPGAAGTGDPDLTADRVDLRYLVEGYAIACDTRDPDALGACFADGAVLTVHWPDRAATRLAFPESAAAITTNLSRYDRTLPSSATTAPRSTATPPPDSPTASPITSPATRTPS